MNYRPTGVLHGRAALAALAVTFTLSAHGVTDERAARYYEDALGRYEKKDYSGAVIQLKNALQIDRNQLPVQVLLGKTLLANGDAIAAEVAFREALRLGVNRAEIVLPLAETYITLGKQKQLLVEPAFAPAGLPRDVQLKVLLLRASASADIGDNRTAFGALDEARALDPRSPSPYLAEVPIRIRFGQIKEAETAADRAFSIAPGAAESAYQKGTVLHQRGELKEALDLYAKALQTDPGHTEARLARAGLLVDFGQLQEASKEIDALTRISHLDPRAAYLRALIAERENRPADVTKALRQVTELLDPVPPDFIRYRPQIMLLNGLAHLGLNETAKAKPLLEAIQRMQGASPVSKLLSQIYLSERDTSKAISTLESYLRTYPADAQAINLLASAHMQDGRDGKAAALMQEALNGRDTPELRTTLGISLINTGRAGDALGHLEKAFRKDNNLIQAGTALVGLYLRGNQTAKAISVAETLTRKKPDSAGLHNLHGLALTAAGNAAAARAAFEKALKVDVQFMPAQLNLVRLDISARAFDNAAQRLAAILRKNERSTDALFEMALLSERQGKLADMQGWLEKAASYESPRHWRAGLALVDLHLAQGRPQQALEAAKRITGKAPDDPNALIALARANLANNDPAGARSALTTATRVAEYNATLQVRIATLQIAANHLPGATYSIEKALMGKPGFLPAMVLANEIDIRQGQFAQAETRARKVIEQHPKRSVGHLMLGDLATSRKQPGSALEWYRKAHQTEPSTTTVLKVFSVQAQQEGDKAALQTAEQWLRVHPKDIVVARAVADGKARTGDYQAARVAYEQLLKLAPDDINAMNNLTNVLYRLKDSSALKVAEATLTKAPGNPNVIDTLGWILLQNGQTDRALQLLRDARLRAPDNPDIRYHLAEALVRTNRPGEAKEELQIALNASRPFEHREAAAALLRKISQ